MASGNWYSIENKDRKFKYLSKNHWDEFKHKLKGLSKIGFARTPKLVRQLGGHYPEAPKIQEVQKPVSIYIRRRTQLRGRTLMVLESGTME